MEVPKDEDFTAQVTVEYPAKSLTGMMSVFINNRTLTATVRMRREKEPVWEKNTPSFPSYSCASP
jgi:hypothetical protein